MTAQPTSHTDVLQPALIILIQTVQFFGRLPKQSSYLQRLHICSRSAACCSSASNFLWCRVADSIASQHDEKIAIASTHEVITVLSKV